MTSYEIALLVHRSAMFLAIALLILGEMLLLALRLRGGGPFKSALLARRFATMAMGVGLLAGATLVYLAQWSLLTPWLDLSFALIAAVILINRFLVAGWEKQVEEHLRRPWSFEEIRTLVLDKKVQIGRSGMIVLLVLIANIMESKPDLLG